MAELYQIYYKEEQKPTLFPFAIPYFNDQLSIFFENDVIVKLVTECNSAKISVCSHKLREKLHYRVGARAPLTEEALNSDYEVLSFTRNTKYHNMMARASVWHNEFLPTITKLWAKLGYKMPSEVKSPIYQNHYSAKIDIYQEYVFDFLIPAMKLVHDDTEMHNLMLKDSGYHSLTTGDISAVSEKTGLSYYPLCPFVLERCPALWFHMKKIKVSYL
jgi:hypothetical protein